MRYGFLVETYATERIKVVSVWSEFRDEDLPFRPNPKDARGRSVHEQMVHQCVSENLWFKNMLGIDAAITIKQMQDFRNYKVSCEKARNILSFKPRFDVEAIVRELAENVSAMGDMNDERYYNIRTFKKLYPEAAKSGTEEK